MTNPGMGGGRGRSEKTLPGMRKAYEKFAAKQQEKKRKSGTQNSRKKKEFP